MAETVVIGRWRFERESSTYTLLFAAAVCVVCGLLVAVAAVALAPSQEAAQQSYLQKNVLVTAGLLKPGEVVSDRDVQRLFAQRIELRLIEPAKARLLPKEELDPASYNPRKARSDPKLSREAPANRAGIPRLPNYQVLYLVKRDGQLDQLVLAIEGLGMWGTMYGFIALDADGNTVRGLTYYEQKETPGLGGEIGNPKWQALWHGRKVYDAEWQPKLMVVKGPAGPANRDPHRVDGLSGSTVTSNAVSRVMQFWFSEDGYGRFLAALREAKVKP